MQFTNEFTIPLDIDRALGVLTDLERVAPCFPGATLESVDGDTYSGRVKVKVGPMSLTYAGDATVAQVDEEAHTARIEASGREKRGGGTASADVGAELRETDEGTVVVVTTDLDVTGKPAQFGRGVMADVGAKIIDRFAENLRLQLEEEGVLAAEEAAAEEAAEEADAEPDAEPAEEADAEPEASAAATAAGDEQQPAAGDKGAEVASADEAGASGPRRLEEVAPRDEALDLTDAAREATLKRLVPVAVAVAVLLVLWLVLRDHDDEDG